jgi:hypothetical protein
MLEPGATPWGEGERTTQAPKGRHKRGAIPTPQSLAAIYVHRVIGATGALSMWALVDAGSDGNRTIRWLALEIDVTPAFGGQANHSRFHATDPCRLARQVKQFDRL